MNLDTDFTISQKLTQNGLKIKMKKHKTKKPQKMAKEKLILP